MSSADERSIDGDGVRAFVAVNRRGRRGRPFRRRLPARIEARLRSLTTHEYWSVKPYPVLEPDLGRPCIERDIEGEPG